MLRSLRSRRLEARGRPSFETAAPRPPQDEGGAQVMTAANPTAGPCCSTGRPVRIGAGCRPRRRHRRAGRARGAGAARRPGGAVARRCRRHLGASDPLRDPDRAGADRAAARRRRGGDAGARRRHRLGRDHLRISRPRYADLAAARCRSRSRPTSWPTSMSTFSTRSGRCTGRSARCSAGIRPPTPGCRACARSAARSW